VHGQPRASIEAVAWCEEEGSRFPANFLGSRAVTGLLGTDELGTIRDADGTTIEQAMLAAGLEPAQFASARRTDISSYLELHVEQGRVLQDARLPIGVVDVITGIRQLELRVAGQVDHAGTTPMRLRRDAGLAAAEMMLETAKQAELVGPPAVATVGQVSLEPGAVNIVPGQARLTVDARHPDGAALEKLVRRITIASGDIAEQHDVRLDVETLVHVEPAPMNGDLTRVEDHAYAQRRGPRRPDHGAAIPLRDDFCAESRRPQPLPGGIHLNRRRRAGH
jgi:allantoate deiminase